MQTGTGIALFKLVPPVLWDSHPLNLLHPKSALPSAISEDITSRAGDTPPCGLKSHRDRHLACRAGSSVRTAGAF